MRDDGEGAQPARRLNSWKEIGAFFGKDERTVKRWEVQRGLPVHRLPGGARTTVYAFADELDRWLRGDRPAAALPGSAPEPRTAETASGRRIPTARLAAGMVVIAALVAASVTLYVQPGRDRAAPPLTTPASRSAHQPPAAAVDLYLAGVYHWNTRTGDGLERALGFFTQAVALDPDYAEAYAGLANTYNLLSQYTLRPAAEAYPLAQKAAERALALDDRLADGYSALAFTTFYWLRDTSRAQELFKKALALDPSSSRTYHWYALVMMHTGKFDEPIRAITQAQKLDPQSRSVLANKGLILFHAGRTAEALAILTDLARSAPEFLPPHYYLASLYLDEGRYTDFLRESAEAARLEGNSALGDAIAAGERGFVQAGAHGLFAAMLAVQKQQFEAGRENAFNVARTAALAGEAETALTYLERSIKAGEPDALGIRIDHAFMSLRADTRFQRLAETVLPTAT